MNFSNYFNNWLYGVGGYYANYKDIGKEGDFFTSVSTSHFFGGAIANHLIKRIHAGDLPRDTFVLEIGAHHGYLLADIIQFIYTIDPTLLETLTFGIVERFSHLQEAQLNYFKESFSDVVQLQHFKDVSEIQKKSGFIVANEIFDAFSCEIIHKNQMLTIEDNQAIWIDNIDPFVQKIADKYQIISGEVGLGYENFAHSLFNAFEKSEFVTFDYGDIAPRNDISMRIYSKHKTYPFFDEEADLAALYANSDITYDVHFGHLIDAFKECGYTHDKYLTQLAALTDFGITELLEVLEKNVDHKVYLKEVGKVKTLLNPAFLGERFKMVNFTKF
jgi:SAM-dependent MidA family methyltransferase